MGVVKEKRDFQNEETESAGALRWAEGYTIWATSRRAMWPDQREWGIPDRAGDEGTGVKSIKILEHVKKFGLYPKNSVFPWKILFYS